MTRLPTRRTLVGVLAGAVAAGGAVVGLPTTAATAANPAGPGVRSFGLTAAGDLVRFNTAQPEGARRMGKIRLGGGEDVVGIDIRPANTRLYALGSEGGLFRVNKRNANTTKVGQLSVGLRGQRFDIDVNPAADALRIISNRGQNLRYSFAARTTTVDGVLNVPDGTDRATGYVGAAYTNNDNDDDNGTALYVINHASDSLALQAPANAGSITSLGQLTKKTTARMGIDILSRRLNGTTTTNVGFATLGGPNGYALVRVDLTSGRTTRIGGFGPQVVDIAVTSG